MAFIRECIARPSDLAPLPLRGGQPHVGLPDMSVSFEVRKRTTQPGSPCRLARQGAKFKPGHPRRTANR